MKKIYLFLFFVLLISNSNSIAGSKQKMLEVLREDAELKKTVGYSNKTNADAWAFASFIPDLGNYSFKSIANANDVVWISGSSAVATNPRAIYGFIVKFNSNSAPNVTSFKYVDGNLGGLGGIAAFDDKIAVMGLYSGELVRTTNGGTTWDTVHVYNIPDTAFIDGVKRVPGTDTVYAFGDADSKGVFIGRSVNKGLTWTRLTVGPKGSKSTWWGYAGYDQCLAVVPGKVWYTAYSSLPLSAPKDSLLISSSTDGGATWEETSIFLAPSVARNYYFRSINFKDANVGYAVSKSSHLTLADNDNRYHRTTDGGKTWSDTISMEPTQLSKTHKVYSVKNIPGTDWVLGVGFSTLTGSKSWLSKDGGLTFSVLPTPGTTSLVNSTFINNDNLLVVGYKSVLVTPTLNSYDDPKELVAKWSIENISVDGKLTERDWATAQTLLFGLPNVSDLKLTGEKTVTGFVDVKNNYDVGGKKYTVPVTDPSAARVKFLRRGAKLYIGISSDDKSICKFGWEGDGLFLKLKNSAGDDKEFKLYYQNTGADADTIKYEEPAAGSGRGAGALGVGGKVNDTVGVDNGYTAELEIDLTKLGFAENVESLTLSLNVFDPDGIQHPMNEWDTTKGSFYKSYWGSEWGGVYRKLNLKSNPYEDPANVIATNANENVTVDGKLTEGDWSKAQTLLFGLPNVSDLKLTGEKTVTGFVDVKNNYDVGGKKYTVPVTDPSAARVKFLRRGAKLYIGISSDDKSICKFGWEGDGLFLKLKNSAGDDKEFKLYYQNTGTDKDTIKYEEPSVGFGRGAGVLGVGGKVNDTVGVDNGYTAELEIDLTKLGFAENVESLTLSLNVFDPDGFQHPMNEWDTTKGSFYKSFWGSEWGGIYRNVLIKPEIKKDPKAVFAHQALNEINVDGKLTESDWAKGTKFNFGAGADKNPVANLFYTTSGIIVKSPYRDTSNLILSVVQYSNKLFIGLQSNDKQVCKFGDSWEGDGIFMKIKNAAGEDKEFKLYFNNWDSTKMTYEDSYNGRAGKGVSSIPAGTKPHDSTNVDEGYEAELVIYLDTLGYTTIPDSIAINIVMFDPDFYTKGMVPWTAGKGDFYKEWWGTEWGTDRMLKLNTTVRDPKTLIVSKISNLITVDGIPTEAEWGNATSGIVFRAGAVGTPKPFALATSGVIVKGPYRDTTGTVVLMRQSGLKLYLAILSNDKQVCKFGDSWEGDGIFMKIRNAAGADKEFKLYFNNWDSTKMIYEDSYNGNAGKGASSIPAGTKPHDSTNVDEGYTAEIVVYLDSLGYKVTDNTITIPININIFDPDYYVKGMLPWTEGKGEFYKHWWGSEWGTDRAIVLDKTTNVVDDKIVLAPNSIELNNNYPNPFNPSTKISFKLGSTEKATLKVFNMLGQEVATIAEGIFQANELQSFNFNASKLASGMYIYQLRTATKIDSKKMMLLK